MLENVRILEFGQIANPDSVGLIIAVHGADVIRVESLSLGDYIPDIGALIVPVSVLSTSKSTKNKRSSSSTMYPKIEEARTSFSSRLDTAIEPFDFSGSPVRAEGQPYSIRRYAPALDEHTREVWAELGLSADDIRHLEERKAV